MRQIKLREIKNKSKEPRVLKNVLKAAIFDMPIEMLNSFSDAHNNALGRKLLL